MLGNALISKTSKIFLTNHEVRTSFGVTSADLVQEDQTGLCFAF